MLIERIESALKLEGTVTVCSAEALSALSKQAIMRWFEENHYGSFRFSFQENTGKIGIYIEDLPRIGPRLANKAYKQFEATLMARREISATAEITPDMVSVITDWFEGSFMKRGLPGARLKSLLAWKDVSVKPSKLKTVFRAHLVKINPGAGIIRHGPKEFKMVKAVGTVKSWTTSENVAKMFYQDNFQSLTRGRNKLGLILKMDLADNEYVTDIDTVVSLLQKSGFKQESKNIDVRFKSTKEVLVMIHAPKVVDCVGMMQHD